MNAVIVLFDHLLFDFPITKKWIFEFLINFLKVGSVLLVSGVSLGDIHFFGDVISFADDGDDDDHED